jgi:hypothetical protein
MQLSRDEGVVFALFLIIVGLLGGAALMLSSLTALDSQAALRAREIEDYENAKRSRDTDSNF